jgi:hypothetical protein
MLRECDTRSVIAERGHPQGNGQGTFRRVVERAISWLHGSHRDVRRRRWDL